MPRRFLPRSRLSGVRDAKLIVIASEGAKTEPTYFRELASLASNSRVKVLPLMREETEIGHSSPRHVVEMLEQYKDSYPDQEEDDELWAVVDVDNYDLSEIGRLCHQKGYELAVSNPCVEIWFLLHLKSLDEYSQETLDEFRENAKVTSNRNRLEAELLDILGEYNKSKPKVKEHFYHHTEKAIERARKLDNLELRWPGDLGSRIYLIVEKITR